MNISFAHAPTAENLIGNADFEDEYIVTSVPQGWYAAGTLSSVVYQKTGGYADAGERCALITADTACDASMRQGGLTLFVDTNKTYTYKLSGYIKTENLNYSGSVGAGVAVIDNGWSKQYGFNTATKGTSDWTYFEKTFTISKASNNGIFTVVVFGSKLTGKMWADGLKLEPVSDDAKAAASNSWDVKPHTISHDPTAGNLIGNADFEDEDRGDPLGWSNTAILGVLYEKTGGIFNDHCIHVTTYNGDATLRQGGVTLVVGGTYKLTGYVRTENFNYGSSGGGVAIINTGWSKQYAYYAPKGTSPGWIYFEQTITITQPSVDNLFTVIVYGSKCSGDMWVDGLTLKPVSDNAIAGSSNNWNPNPLPVRDTSFMVQDAFPTGNRLNQLVVEYANTQFSDRPEADYTTTPYYEVPFTINRDNWIYFKLDAEPVLSAADCIYVTFDDMQLGDSVLKLDSDTAAKEKMQFMGKGSHILKIWTKGSPNIKGVVVRAVPEVVYYSLASAPSEIQFASERGASPAALALDEKRTLQYLEGNKLIDSYNSISSIAAGSVSYTHEYDTDMAVWKAEGKRWNIEGQIPWYKLDENGNYVLDENGNKVPVDLPTAINAFKRQLSLTDISSILLNEFTYKDVNIYNTFAQAIETLSSDPACQGRSFYAWMSANYIRNYDLVLYNFMKYGHKIIPEIYINDQDTEANADAAVRDNLLSGVMSYNIKYPGINNYMFLGLCLTDSPDCSWHKYPQADYKVFLDKQFHLIANDPNFKDLYGLTMWSAHYVDDELLAWYNKLVRHYFIEGNTSYCSETPYTLSYIDNPGFESGDTGWTFSPAATGSMYTTSYTGFIKGSYPLLPEHSKVLYTKKDVQNPNKFSQIIKNLTPGKLYYLKFNVFDKNDFSTRKIIDLSADLNGVELIPDKTVNTNYLYGRSQYYIMAGTEKQNVDVCYNCREYVFKALSDQAEIVFSDWKDGTAPTQDVGQELYWDAVEVAPYYERDVTPPATTAAVVGTEKNGWYSSDVAVTLSASDDMSGVGRTMYRIGDSGSWTLYAAPVTISQEGTSVIQYYSVDKDGNAENVQQQEIKIDKSEPTISLMVDGSTLNDAGTFDDYLPLTFKAGDSLSGLASAKLTLDGNVYDIDPQMQAGIDVNLAGKLGSHTAVITVEDKAGNRSEENLSFTVTTSINSMKQLVKRFEKSNDLKRPLPTVLTAILDQKQKMLDKGRPDIAAKLMEVCLKIVDNKAFKMLGTIKENARVVLHADGEWLKNKWSTQTVDKKAVTGNDSFETIMKDLKKKYNEIIP
jgi:Carbohydrate binding domain.